MESNSESRQRNAHKRHSGIQDHTGQFVQRRTSKRTSSNDRHGHVYPDNFTETTIRPVSPEPPPISDADRYMSDPGTLPARSATPLPTSCRGHQPRSRTGTPPSHPNGHTPSPSSSGVRASHPHARTRTRTLEESVRDERSPTSLVSKTRQRIGSLESAPFRDRDETSSSIGFPSIIIPSPPLEAQFNSSRRRLAKPQSRTLSPIRNPALASRHASSSSSSATATDANKILQLMKTTCGRMHGILSFRTPAMTSWSSGYCAINVATGSLIYQTKGDVSLAKTLVSDLRGCQVRTLYDGETRSTFLDVSTLPNAGIHLRPHVPETFDSWLAALLCWQPIKPKGVHNKSAKLPTPLHSGPRRRSPGFERRMGDRRRNSENVQTKDASIIKVGNLLLWDKDVRSGESSPLHTRRGSIYKLPKRTKSTSWRKVSCTLHDNGHLKLLTDVTDAAIPLSHLSRCAIQRLDPSVLESEFSLAIYPQYSSVSTTTPGMNTIYLAMESRVLFEVWFVLLRAFTIPDLYGPEQIPNPRLIAPELGNATSRSPAGDMFRVERQLSLRIIEAKLHSNRGKHTQGLTAPSRHQNASKQDMISGNYFTEVRLDGEIRGKTAVQSETSNPFWREDFEFFDLPTVLSSARIDLKTRNPGQRDWTLVSQAPLDIEHGDINPLSIVGDIEISPLDLIFGKVDMRLDDIEKATDTERWWPIVNEHDDVVGELLMKVRIEELVVLMGRDYQPLSELLHTFSNGLTNQIAQMAHLELRRLSETLLNIFQVSAQAGDWIMSLVEDEIDNIHKDTPVSKFRYGRRIASNDSYESGVEREMFLRDLGKSATVEANLLFRGNSLLTKALDLHMRRLGKEYLEDTLSEFIRDIDESDPECEVNPNHVQNPDDLRRNWRNLITLTENLWKSIAASSSRCPPELRMIFRHIRACADDRYGDFLRTVTYSSVSGFLFLRFFCPAVLNPKLFGLLKDHPRPRAHRTLTLITKALQTLANLTTFGSKEPWMEPMNQFLNSHRQEFKDFVDAVCGISPDRSTSAIPPSYATPITILGRLPGTSREGFPSLPYLIDQARECAVLVNLWLEVRDDVEAPNPMSEELKRFDALCEQSRQKTKDCLEKAEQAERHSGLMEPKWEALAEQMARPAKFRELNGRSTPATPRIAGSLRTENSSTSSLGETFFDRKLDSPDSPTYSERLSTRAATDGGSKMAANEVESSGNETDIAPASSSAVWDPGVTRPDDKSMWTLPVKDDERDSVEMPETMTGSSIYSLGSNPSNKLAKPARSPAQHHRKRDKKSVKSAYSLDKSPSHERQGSGKSAGHGHGHGHMERASSSGTGRSVYRLKELSAEAGRKSPGSRDGAGGILRVGDFGSFFKRKVKEKDEEWKS